MCASSDCVITLLFLYVNYSAEDDHAMKNPFCTVESLEVRKELFTSSKLNMGVIFTLLILIFNYTIISGYNLEMRHRFLLRHENVSSYYGYSIILHKTGMIVGAPKDNFPTSKSYHPQESGAVWHYRFNNNKSERFKPTIPNGDGYIKERGWRLQIEQKNGWFGASMALMGDGDILTVCAPRSILTIFFQNNTRQEGSMHGACYVGNISSQSNNLRIRDPDFSTFDFKTGFFYHPLCGFSIHYPSLETSQTRNDLELIIGCPKHNNSGSVKIEKHGKTLFMSEFDDDAQFGYAVTSGHFFNRNKLLYVGGGPRWNYVGQVGIIDPDQSEVNQPSIISRLYGMTIGEYFGASLTSGDMNNDGLDDLIIGAPHYGNDNGRVYIYLGNTKGFSVADVVLNGYSDDGLFGYSVITGDLDADGFDDLIVGAPFEKGGTIYIYNGDPKINQETMKSSQNVTAFPSVQTFGFSLSKPIDIDDNGFPDVGVGAYKTGHAGVLKSRPVIETNLQVSADPLIINQNSTDFLVKICVRHTERKLPVTKSFNLNLNVDENHKRVRKSQVGLIYIQGWDQSSSKTEVCLNTTVHILENVEKNFYDPIDIVISHEFGPIQIFPDQRIGRCELCPIEVEGALSKTTRLSVPFDLGCGSDEKCFAVIELHANFQGNELAWIIGSGDITYEVYITNYGEPAYSTEIIVEIPQGISVRTYSSTWKKYKDTTGLLKIICRVANPLYANDTKKIDIVFDMSQFDNGSVNGTYLNFHVSAKTRSENSGRQNISSTLLLLSHITTTIEGNANDENYHYTLDDETPNINFQHSYAVVKSGATPINKARLCIDVPTKYKDLNLIDFADKPDVLISGKICNCSVINALVHDKVEILDSTISKNPDNKQMRMVRDTSELSQNFPPQLVIEFNNAKHDHVINLDCLSPDISCDRITCDIPHLASQKDTVALRLRFLMNFKLLANMKEIDLKKYSITFTTQGWIEIVEPFIESKKIARIHTTFRHVEKLKRINIWIIISSVLIGLLILSVVTFFLWKLGFFKRTKKEKMKASMTEDKRNSQLKNSKFRPLET